MHIGLIGGIGPAATEYYYRGLVRQSPTTSPLELTIVHADLDTLLKNLATGDPDKQARVFCNHIEQLKSAGAEFAAVTSIAGHFCFRELEAVSPLPLVSALKSVSDEFQQRRLSRVGLLGSSVAMESGLYGAITGVEIVLPQGEDLKRVSDEYFAMARAQMATTAQRELFVEAGARLCSEQGAEVVVLAGTDMFLAFAGMDPGFEVIDCAEAHIMELARIAGQSTEQLL